MILEDKIYSYDIFLLTHQEISYQGMAFLDMLGRVFPGTLPVPGENSGNTPAMEKKKKTALCWWTDCNKRLNVVLANTSWRNQLLWASSVESREKKKIWNVCTSVFKAFTFFLFFGQSSMRCLWYDILYSISSEFTIPLCIKQMWRLSFVVWYVLENGNEINIMQFQICDAIAMEYVKFQFKIEHHKNSKST